MENFQSFMSKNINNTFEKFERNLINILIKDFNMNKLQADIFIDDHKRALNECWKNEYSEREAVVSILKSGFKK